jgi:predicted NUDIX family phosphoesterase
MVGQCADAPNQAAQTPANKLRTSCSEPVRRKEYILLEAIRIHGQSFENGESKGKYKMATEERVLCFQRNLLEKLGVFQGLSLEVEKYLPVVTSSSHLVYLNRSDAELDKRYKQLIPYVLIICNGKILRYRRGKGGQETRLHGLYSVGIGGHISEEDNGLFSGERAGYQEGMRRELMEEVAIEDANEATVAVINDDSTDVGQVHFGVVHIMYVPNEDVAGHRSGIASPEFIPMADAVKDASGYESWSRSCLEHLEVLLAKAAAAGVSNPERLVT